MSSNTDKIKRLDLFLKKKGSSGKPKKAYTEKIKTLQDTYEYELYSDFVSDGKSKELATEIIIKADGTPPQNIPPVINVKKIWNAQTGTKDFVIGGSINDVNGNLATVVWTIIAGTTIPFVVAPDQQSIKFDVPEAEGQIQFNIEATDSDGAKATQDVELNIKKQPDPEPQPTGIMFAYSADTDTTSEAEDIHNQIARENPDTWVFGGDGPYAKEGTSWTQMLDQIGMGSKKPFFTKGNHDTKSSESQQTEDDIEEWYRGLIAKFPEHNLIDLNTIPEDAGNPNWDTPDWLQTRIIGDVYLFSMNSEDMDIEFEGRNQYNWVTKKVLPEIKQLKAEGKINWAFAVSHKPWFTLKSSHGPEKTTREIYMKLFATDNGLVDGILQGHNHNIQLWHPMALDTNNNAVAVYTFVENTQIYDFTKPHGLIIHINGAGGHENNGFTEPVLPTVRYANDKDDGYSLIYSDSEKKQLSIVIKKTDGSILHTAIYSKSGNVEPEPDKPQLNLSFPSTIEVLKTGTIDATASKNLDSVIVEQTTTQNIDLQQDGTNWKWSFTPPDIENTRAVTNTYSLGFRSEGRKGNTIIQKSMQISVTKTGTEPPGQYPIEFDKFYTSEQVLAQNDKNLQSSQYEIDEVCLPSGASGAKNHKLQNHRIVIDSGGGNGRIYWDFHRVNNKAIEQVPNFGFKHAFGGSFILGGDNLSVKIGNHGSDGREYDGKYVFGGFGFSLHASECQSKVEYWHNNQGSEVAESYPNGRTLQKGKEYKFFCSLIGDPQSNEATLNVWVDFNDGAGYLNVMNNRKWGKSGWSPGSVPNGSDTQWIKDGPGHIKSHTVWTRANSGSSTVWDLVYGIPK